MRGLARASTGHAHAIDSTTPDSANPRLVGKVAYEVGELDLLLSNEVDAEAGRRALEGLRERAGPASATLTVLCEPFVPLASTL